MGHLRFELYLNEMKKKRLKLTIESHSEIQNWFDDI